MKLSYLGLPRSSRLLIVVALVDSLGTGLFLSGSAVFFTRSAELSTTEVGVGLTGGGLCALLTLTPLGMLADRIGPRAAAVLMHFWRAIGFVGYAFVHDFVTFLLIACFVVPPTRAIEPIGQMFVDRAVGAELRVRVMAVFRSVYNIGFTLGALLTTIVLVIDTRDAFLSIVLGNAFTFLIAGFLLARVPLLPDSKKPERKVFGWPHSLRQGRYLVVAGLNGLLIMHIPLLGIAVPLWVTLHTSAPRVLVGPLIMVNTLLVILLQVRISRGTDTLDGGVVAMRRASVCLAACAIVFAFASRFDAFGASVLLCLGMVLLSFGELLQSAGGWSLSYELAPRDRQGEYLAVFNLGVAAMYTAGPALVAIGIVDRGLPGWLVLAACFLIAGALLRPAVAKADKQLSTVSQ